MSAYCNLRSITNENVLPMMAMSMLRKTMVRKKLAKMKNR